MYLRTADRHNDKGTVRPAIQCRDTPTTKRVRFATKRRPILPLPKGEGRGEGEAILETPMYLRTADRHNDKGTVRPASQCRATRTTKRVRFHTKRRSILPLT